jgi:hypothetical protein
VEGAHVGLGAGNFGAHLSLEEIWHGNGGQNGDDGDDNEEFDEGEGEGRILGPEF